MDKKEKIAGCILGMIIGDVLAFPLKHLPYEERKQYFPVNNLVEPFDYKSMVEEGEVKFNEIKNMIQNWYPAGYYSCNVQQALLVLDSIISFQDVDIENISQRLVKYSYPRDRTAPLGVFRGYTKPFFDSVQNIVNGLPLRVCGVTYCSGDAAFKTIPIALFYGMESKLLSDKSLDVTLLTNRDVTAIASSSAIGCAIAQASSKSYFNVDEELRRIIDAAKHSENFCLKRYQDFLSDSAHRKHLVSDSLNELYRLKDAPTEEGIQYYKDYATHNNLRHDSSVVTTAVSLLMFIKNIGNFEYSVKNSLELNVNIEIVTPLVAAISGSLLGVEKIPKYWRKLIASRKDLVLKSENLRTEEEKPAFKNYYIKEIELSDQQYASRELAFNFLEENYASKPEVVT